MRAAWSFFWVFQTLAETKRISATVCFPVHWKSHSQCQKQLFQALVVDYSLLPWESWQCSCQKLALQGTATQITWQHNSAERIAERERGQSGFHQSMMRLQCTSKEDMVIRSSQRSMPWGNGFFWHALCICQVQLTPLSHSLTLSPSFFLSHPQLLYQRLLYLSKCVFGLSTKQIWEAERLCAKSVGRCKRIQTVVPSLWAVGAGVKMHPCHLKMF